MTLWDPVNRNRKSSKTVLRDQRVWWSRKSIRHLLSGHAYKVSGNQRLTNTIGGGYVDCLRTTSEKVNQFQEDLRIRFNLTEVKVRILDVLQKF